MVAKETPALSHQVVINNVDKAVVIVILCVRAHCGNRVSIFVVGGAVSKTHLFKFTPASIHEKKVALGIVCNEYVHKPIAVEIRDAYAHSLSFRRTESGGLRHIFKSSLAKVVIKPLGHV